MSTERRLEEAEAAIAALPEAGPGLEPEAERDFLRARRRIHRHHTAWRDGMPALDTLFDGDAHRARALAGSLCTELEDVLVAWGAARASCGPADEQATRFLDDVTRRWCAAAAEVGAEHRFDDEGRRVFSGFLEELAARARERGLAVLAGETNGRPLPPPRWRVALRKLVRGPLIAVRRFLRPDLP